MLGRAAYVIQAKGCTTGYFSSSSAVRGTQLRLTKYKSESSHTTCMHVWQPFGSGIRMRIGEDHSVSGLLAKYLGRSSREDNKLFLDTAAAR